eukprot:COSAG01_NODE_951_length_12498_cov_30.544018_8_plen_127_part_00
MESYSGNLLLWVGDCIMNGMTEDNSPGHAIGYGDAFVNNSCVYRHSYESNCFTSPRQPSTGRGWQVHDNRVFSANGSTMVCNNSLTLEEWVARGHDHGSTSQSWPTNAEVTAWGRALLGMHPQMSP